MNNSEELWAEFIYQIEEIKRANPDWQIAQILNSCNVNKILPTTSDENVVRMVKSYIKTFNLHNKFHLD